MVEWMHIMCRMYPADGGLQAGDTAEVGSDLGAHAGADGTDAPPAAACRGHHLHGRNLRCPGGPAESLAQPALPCSRLAAGIRLRSWPLWSLMRRAIEPVISVLLAIQPLLWPLSQDQAMMQASLGPSIARAFELVMIIMLAIYPLV